MACAKRAPEAVRRALGADRNIPDDQLGDALFDAVVGRRSGALITEHAYDEVWSLISHPDRTIRLAIPSLLEWLDRLHPAGAEAGRSSHSSKDGIARRIGRSGWPIKSRKAHGCNPRTQPS